MIFDLIMMSSAFYELVFYFRLLVTEIIQAFFNFVCTTIFCLFMNKISSYIYSLLLIFCCNLTFASEDISFKHYTSNDGLIHNTVYTITQDGEGFMWFGTVNGLSKFDGLNFTNYQYNINDKYGIPEGEVRQLETDKNGNIWLLVSGKIARFDKDTENFITIDSLRTRHESFPASVNSIYSDKNGNLWLCTLNGLFKYDFETQLFSQADNFSKEVLKSSIKALLQDSNGNYWLVKEDAINILKNITSKTIEKTVCLLGDKTILKGFEDIKEGFEGRIYVSIFERGIFAIEKENQKIEHFTTEKKEGRISSDATRPLEVDKKGFLWIGTELGVNTYDSNTNRSEIHLQDFNNSQSLNDNAIYSIYRDQQDNMWVGTFFGGVNVFLNSANHFQHYQAGAAPHALSGKALSQIIEDDKGNLWIGTEDAGLNYFDTKEEKFIHYTSSSEESLSYNNVHALCLGANKKLWVGTYLGGLNVLSDNKFRHYKVNGKKGGILSNSIYGLLHYEEKMWIGSIDGLFYFDDKANSFARFPGFIGRIGIMCLHQDANENIWIGSTYNGVFVKYAQSDTIYNLSDILKDKSQILPKDINYIHGSVDGLIWIGTNKGGLFQYDPTNNKIKQYTTKEGLPDQTIYAIVEDEENNLWMTSNNGLICFLRSENYFRVFTTKDGLPNNQFNFRSAYRHSNGKIYLGSIDGMIAFDPKKIRFNNQVPGVRITRFTLFNKVIKGKDASGILKEAIFNTKVIELKNDQSVIGFEFAAIDYTSPQNNRFAYKMEGLEEKWNEVRNYNKANYSHLPPGNYTFRVKACNNDGVWNETGTSIRIVVNPPFWSSKWGYMLYILMVSVIFWIYYRIAKIRTAEKSALYLAQIEKNKQDELNELKLKFYTNVSHEFRTPLSLIIDPLERLAEEKSKNDSGQKTLQLVLKNAHRLQVLINQLLEFRKTESGQFELKVSQGNLKEFIHNIFNQFKTLADSRNIQFEFVESEMPETLWFDKKIVEIILDNLLSNAFKFTNEGEKVCIALKWNTSEEIQISVSDTGIGMSKIDLQRIFDRFYQIEGTQQSENSSGIGLALTKSLVELHHGTIHVESEEDKGSIFTVKLAVAKGSFSLEEQGERVAIGNSLLLTDEINLEEKEISDLIFNQENKTILVVEDNKELQGYLKSTLCEDYKVITADNGKEGWDAIQKQQPDVIISDVMMPIMDGFELCKMVKSDIQTSHIPVILLTARTSITDKSEGLQYGANIYMEKPFNSSILRKHLTNLIHFKATLKKRFESDLGIDVSEATHSTRDEKFLKNAIQIVHQQMDNSDFNVALFIDKMAVSRTLLHMKLKEITGKSASEFIQSLRMKEAARLLKSDSSSISEISGQVGFQDPSYFSKCFKKHFKISPKEYQKK